MDPLRNLNTHNGKTTPNLSICIITEPKRRPWKINLSTKPEFVQSFGKPYLHVASTGFRMTRPTRIQKKRRQIFSYKTNRKGQQTLHILPIFQTRQYAHPYDRQIGIHKAIENTLRQHLRKTISANFMRTCANICAAAFAKRICCLAFSELVQMRRRRNRNNSVTTRMMKRNDRLLAKRREHSCANEHKKRQTPWREPFCSMKHAPATHNHALHQNRCRCNMVQGSEGDIININNPMRHCAPTIE